MEFTKNAILFLLTLLLIKSSWSLEDDKDKVAAPQQHELGKVLENAEPALSRVKRQFGYGYGVLPYPGYYGVYRRPYPVPIPIIIGGGGLVVGRGFGGFGGRGFGGRGFGGRGFGGKGFGEGGFGGRGFGGRGYGGRGFGGRGIGGRGGGFGGGRGGRG